MKEVVEMAYMLLEMGTDTYMKSKCMLLAASREHPGDRHFFEVLFNSVEKKRPLPIEDKGGKQEMKVDDIKIYPCFAAHEPRPEKMQQKEQYFEETGALQSQIILDSRGNLIDGYTSYLIAKQQGIESVSVQYGQRQIVRASHKPGGKMYAWELPGLLIDRVFPGDKVLVNTKRGARTVIVTAVEDYAGQEQEPLRMVIRARKRAGSRREEYINKINQQLSTIKDTWILDQIYKVTVNIMN